MTIVGFAFKKVLAEKEKPIIGKTSISNNVSIKDVKESDLNVGQDKASLKFEFEYTSAFEPGVGKISLVGELMYLGTSVQVKEILDYWKKKKTLPSNVMIDVINNVLYKCNVEALLLSREVNLPPPIQLPKATLRQSPQKEKEEKSSSKKK
ncbi:MAG: hypothetical protein V1659_01940 [Candidatus Woesearchaeota archaeon]